MKKSLIITAVLCVLFIFLSAIVPMYMLLKNLTLTPELTSANAPMTQAENVADKPSPPEDDPTVTVTLSFIGDCMLATDRGGEWQGSFNLLAKQVEPSYFFESFTELFTTDDWTVANLENVFTDNPDAKMRNKGYTPAYWYKSTAANTDILTAGGIDVVSLANNHSQDYGEIGYADTRAALDAAGVIWGDNDNMIMLGKDGFTIALYATTFYYRGYESIIAQRMSAVDADYKIVYLHGGTERVHVPDEWKAEGCRKLIDSGADLVVGHHPHVLQPIEVYKGKTIVHSLGNFVFGGSRSEENRTIVYRHTITAVGGEVTDIGEEVIPCYVYTDLYKPGIITNEEEISAVHAFLRGESDTPINK